MAVVPEAQPPSAARASGCLAQSLRKLLLDIHASIEDSNDHDLTGLDYVKCHISIHQNPPQCGAEFTSIGTEKWKFAQFVESSRKSRDDPIRSSGISFGKIGMDGKKIGFGA
jgi:hypothetical protein